MLVVFSFLSFFTADHKSCAMFLKQAGYKSIYVLRDSPFLRMSFYFIMKTKLKMYYRLLHFRGSNRRNILGHGNNLFLWKAKFFGLGLFD